MDETNTDTTAGTAADGAARVVAAVLSGHQRLRTLLDGLTEAAAREPSALPGWSRAHVLAHIGGVGSALARQARFALRGELVEVYDGGRPARDAAIEVGSKRTADELRHAVTEALAEAEGAFTAVGPQTCVSIWADTLPDHAPERNEVESLFGDRQSEARAVEPAGRDEGRGPR